jgi:hypothetical protein
VRGFPRLGDEDNLGDFPLGRKVSAKEYGVVELGEVVDASGGKFLERFGGDEVITG